MFHASTPATMVGKSVSLEGVTMTSIAFEKPRTESVKGLNTSGGILDALAREMTSAMSLIKPAAWTESSFVNCWWVSIQWLILGPSSMIAGIARLRLPKRSAYQGFAKTPKETEPMSVFKPLPFSSSKRCKSSSSAGSNEKRINAFKIRTADNTCSINNAMGSSISNTSNASKLAATLSKTRYNASFLSAPCVINLEM